MSENLTLKRFLALCFLCAIFAGYVLAQSVTIEAQGTYPRAEGRLGQVTVIDTIRIHTVGTTAPISIDLRGTHKSHFKISQTSVPAGDHTVDIVVTYEPTAIGLHNSAKVAIECPSPIEASSMIINMSGIAIDPNNPPLLTATPATLSTFNCKKGETVTQQFSLQSQNSADYINLKTSAPFRISTTQVYKNITANITVTFAPTQSGEFNEEIKISTYGTDTLVISLHGIATEDAEPEVKEGDTYALNNMSPMEIMFEPFDATQKNRPISIEEWKNVAMEGNRAWWGYEFTNGTDTNRVAKATGYDSSIAIGDETKSTMWLLTPAFKFAGAPSTLFTFRVMGEQLLENQTDTLRLLCIEKGSNDTIVNQVPVAIPATADFNGEWSEIHIDMADFQNFSPANFFMAFEFTTMRGRNNSAVYYIDDVTYGRQDVPKLVPSTYDVAVEAEVGKEYTSQPISLTTNNAYQGQIVELKVGGPNRSKFSVTKSTINPNGDSFQFKFKSNEVGVHAGYVKISSYGASDTYVVLTVNNIEATTGLSDVLKEPTDITIYDMAGRQVAFIPSYLGQINQINLPQGTYIIKAKDFSQKIVLE